MKGNLLREILREMRENSKGKQWLKMVRGYVKECNIRNMEELNQMDEEKHQGESKEMGERRWRMGMEGKSTLSTYFINENDIKEENIYL